MKQFMEKYLSVYMQSCKTFKRYDYTNGNIETIIKRLLYINMYTMCIR